WRELDGGLISFIGTDHDVHVGKSSTNEPGDELALALFESARLFGWGVDVDPMSHQAVYRVQLTCESSTAAEEMKSRVDAIMQLAKVAASAASEQAAGAKSAAVPDEVKWRPAPAEQ